MSLRSRLILIAVLLCAGTNASAQLDGLEVALTPASQEYCHIIQFPHTWAMPRTDDKTGQRLFFGSFFSEYEFRAEGLQGTRFFVAGITDYPPAPYYTSNLFSVDLSDPTVPIRAASRGAWDSGTIVPVTRRSAFVPGQTVPNDKRLDFHGFQFNRTGEIWTQPSDAATRLSPDQAWLVLQSDAQTSSRGPTAVYFDVFNADTGKKIVTIEGAFSGLDSDMDYVLSKTGWVTERYFIVPLGKQIERSLVCEFGGRKVGSKQ